MKKYRTNILIIVILFTLISNGCLTMQYYPARVAKPGKILWGVGLSGDTYWKVEREYVSIGGGGIYSGLFFRYGLPYNFDIGLDIHSLLIIPYMLSISARKQFDFNNNFINAITFNIEGSVSGNLIEAGTSISMIRNNFAFTVGTQAMFGTIPSFGSDRGYGEIGILIKISNEFKHERFNVMPFLYYRYISISELFHEIGIGVSFYFDLL